MRIRITDWSYENLRVGLGTEMIELGAPPKRWSLVQMPNGTGKTTTMELIRAVLGEREFSPDEVRGFRANDSVTDGKFELGLLIDGEQHRLTLSFDFTSGTYAYSTLRPKERGGGRELGRVLPDDLKHLLKPDFIKLFVFDGELATQIRDLDKKAADHAIKTLYQLDELGVLRLEVEKAVEERQDAAATVSSGRTQRGVSRHRNALNAAKSVLAQLRQQHASLRSDRASLENEAEDKRAQITSHVETHGDLKAEQQKIDREADAIRSEVQAAAVNAMTAFRAPITLSGTIRGRLTGLGQTLTKARLPKSVSSEFFAEIAEQDECICGREIGEAERSVIGRKTEEYLAQDQISAISAMKDRLNSSGDPEITFADACESLGEKIDNRKANEKRQARLLQRVEDQGDGDIAGLRQRLGEIENELEGIEERIERLETTDPVRQKLLGCNADSNVPLARRYTDECDEKLKTASDSFRLSRQRDVLLDQLKRIEAHVLDSLREKIRLQTNDRLKSLVRMEQLQVARIDGALILTSDRVAERKNVSEGQSLSVAYAFLTSLLAESPFDLPFIVDSPAVSLDLDVRREVSRIIPDLFDQMILFVISSEQADFAETFYDRDGTCFVSLRKGADGGVDCVYGLDEFKKRLEEDTAP